MLGRDYIDDHIISCYVSIKEKENLNMYITDCLFALVNNSVKKEKMTMKNRWFDIIHPKEEETRTEEEVVSNIQQKLKALKKNVDSI